METETFWTLFTDLAHWEFEVFLIILFDVIIGLLIWPIIRKGLLHHKSDHERLEICEKEIKHLNHNGRNTRTEK